MKSSGFKEEQITAVLREQEARPSTGGCVPSGISSATFHKWSANQGGLGV